MVQATTSQFEASDGHRVFCYRWLPDQPPIAIVHIAHGMGEHAGRYDWTARQLADAGYAVIAPDHRGHGKTASVYGQFGDDGWNRIIADTCELITAHRAEFGSRPSILFGHSMGSMLTQQYIELHGDTIDGAILSGSPGFTSRLQRIIMLLITRFERWRLGPLGTSALLDAAVFGAANKTFEQEVEKPTGFEWLSRDETQVSAYVGDPACGFVPCTGSLLDLFRGASATQRPSAVANIPRELPILLFSGTDDPVHNGMKNIHRLLAAYRAHELEVEPRFYEGGRHEMLNETNRDAVVADVIAWLRQRWS